MSNKSARKIHTPVDAKVVETPTPVAVKPSLFKRVKARVKTLFSRKPKAVGTGRSVWSRLWAAINRAIQAVVVKPAKKVGRFVARIARKVGAFFARVGRKVAALGRRIAATRGFRIAHNLVRLSLAATILTAWITMFLVTPMITVIYTIGAYLLMEVVAYGLAKLKELRDVDGSRVARAMLNILKGMARAVYVGMQIAFAAIILVGMVLNPALGVLEVICFGWLVYLDKKETESYVPRWQPGTCIGCTDSKLVNVDGLCRECRKLQVEEDTAPFVQDHGTHGVVMG